jgi:two-component system phosphate regulon sensor histidine kinase PhoR
LHAVIPPQLPLLVGEEGMLRQVLINLLDNAFKFTAEGGEIWVSVLPHDNFLEIEVRDTGEGIAVEHIPHVFERFYKVDRSRRSESTGLGLSIVKHIVESQGGTITVESVQGKGCSFIFTLKKATG